MTQPDELARAQARLAARIQGLDLEGITHLESLLAEPQAAQASGPGGGAALTRRQLLGGSAVAAVSLAAGGLGGGAAGAAWGRADGAARERAAADAEIQKLTGLVNLYEQLEKIGIDAVISAGIAAVESGLRGLRDGVTNLRKGVEGIDTAVGAAEGSLDSLRSGLAAAEGFVSLIGGQLKLLQSSLYEVTGKLTPVADAVGGFLADLISKIPFGVGTSILAANSRLGQLVGDLPAAVEGISNQLLAPLRNDWLSDDDTRNIKGRLLSPIRQMLLRPLIKHLDDLAAFLGDLEARLFAPARSALADRARVRDQITRYRASLNMA